MSEDDIQGVLQMATPEMRPLMEVLRKLVKEAVPEVEERGIQGVEGHLLQP